MWRAERVFGNLFIFVFVPFRKFWSLNVIKQWEKHRSNFPGRRNVFCDKQNPRSQHIYGIDGYCERFTLIKCWEFNRKTSVLADTRTQATLKQLLMLIYLILFNVLRRINKSIVSNSSVDMLVMH